MPKTLLFLDEEAGEYQGEKLAITELTILWTPILHDRDLNLRTHRTFELLDFVSGVLLLVCGKLKINDMKRIQFQSVNLI